MTEEEINALCYDQMTEWEMINKKYFAVDTLPPNKKCKSFAESEKIGISRIGFPIYKQEEKNMSQSDKDVRIVIYTDGSTRGSQAPIQKNPPPMPPVNPPKND